VRKDFEKVIDVLAPIALALLRVANSGRSPEARSAESVLRHLLRELEDECPRNVSVRAAEEASRRGYGDLRRYHYDDREEIGNTEFFLWEHYEQVRDMFDALGSLHNPSITEVADILRRARIAWIHREEDERLPKNAPRPDPAAAYASARITLVYDWEQSWPVREGTAALADGPAPSSQHSSPVESDLRELLVSAFAHLGARCDPKPSGYVNIYGPAEAATTRGAALLVVERNGAVSLRNDTLAEALKAPLRPGARRPPEPNDRNYGEARWSISPEELRLRFGDTGQVARTIVAAFERAGLAW
jgi:hypothetical protein